MLKGQQVALQLAKRGLPKNPKIPECTPLHFANTVEGLDLVANLDKPFNDFDLCNAFAYIR